LVLLREFKDALNWVSPFLNANEVIMILNMSHEDMKKLRKDRLKKVVLKRTSRTAMLSDKTLKKVFKKFDQDHDPDSRSKDIAIDEHVKMNDNYMRTGWYVPKKK